MVFPTDPRYRQPHRLRKGTWPHASAPQDGPLEWFALWTEGGREIAVHDELREMLIDTFLPVRIEKRLKPRTQRIRGQSHYRPVRLPLFPCYLFISINRHTAPWGAINAIKGARGFMSNDGRPTPLKNDLIDNLRKAIEEGKHDETVLEAERLAALIGQDVTINKGLLEGKTGRITAAGPNHVTAEISFMGQTRTVKIPRREIEKEK